MDDGTERLRGQLRDAAQDGRSGEDYGGDRIENTAAHILQQAVRGAEEMDRQIQHKREEAQSKLRTFIIRSRKKPYQSSLLTPRPILAILRSLQRTFRQQAHNPRKASKRRLSGLENLLSPRLQNIRLSRKNGYSAQAIEEHEVPC